MAGRKPKDYTGETFERIFVVKRVEPQFVGNQYRSAFLVRCKCGTEKVVLGSNLRSTRSCGCLMREVASRHAKENKPRLKHGMVGTLTYSSWYSMMSRCYRERHREYPRYGGRGITVCERWADRDVGVLNLIEDMGERPSRNHSIDRIDGSKGYSPGNCRWATPKQQNRNIGLKKSNTSGYKGAFHHPSGWTSEIRHDGGKTYLGIYPTKEEAAYAYNLASRKLHGEYGVRNRLPLLDDETKQRVRLRVREVLNKFRT